MFDSRKLTVHVVGDSRQLERTFKRAGKAADKFGSKMRKSLTGGGARSAMRVGGMGGLLGGAGLVGLGIGAGVTSVKAAANFEQTMARIQGLAGQSAKQVAQWSNQLIGLGPALGKTPTELAEALYFIASSGVPASKAIDVLVASAKAAAAGLGETEVVADAVTSVMNAYASSGMTAARATDTLVAIVREGKGEADEFAGVIGNIAAFSSRLGVDFESMGAGLAAMTQLGTDPRTAATQLSAFYSQILKVSEPMQKKAKRLGLGDIFSDLQDMLTKGNLLGALNRLKGMDPLALAQIFPNVRAVRAALALVENDGNRVAGVFARMRNTSGSLGKAWSAAQKTSSHNMEKMYAAIQSLKIAFGQGLAPVVSRVANALARRIANPAFVQRVRDFGFLIGTTLVNKFNQLKTWFQANWPTIKAAILGVMRVVERTVAAFKWLDAHKGPTAPEVAGKATGLFSNVGRFFKVGRASGGPIHPGGVYRVGERGPETIISGMHGTVIPNGAGGGGAAGDVYLDGQKVGTVIWGNAKRRANSTPPSRRGRHGGSSNVALS